ncbi:MAG: transcription factor S [Candidatus Aenigmatarchaeota archaeon]
MEFCKKCGSVMIPEKKGKDIYAKCTKCGHKEKRNIKNLKIIREKKIEKTMSVEKDQVYLPTTEKMCPKCGNIKAYYFLQQTRSADEPPTQFFKCKKCNYVWREY